MCYIRYILVVDCRLLWEFISRLLKDSSYTDYIKWENMSDYTFRIGQFAKLLGCLFCSSTIMGKGL